MARKTRTEGPAGIWILPAALAVLLGIWLLWDLPALRAVWTPVEPVYDIETDAVISVEGARRLDINLAGAEDFAQLSGLGEVLAGRIVEWREAHGAFLSVEQLLQVEGIGEAKLEQLRPYVAVGE